MPSNLFAQASSYMFILNSTDELKQEKNGLDILRGADASVFRSLKVYNVLQSLEKTMI